MNKNIIVFGLSVILSFSGCSEIIIKDAQPQPQVYKEKLNPFIKNSGERISVISPNDTVQIQVSQNEFLRLDKAAVLSSVAKDFFGSYYNTATGGSMYLVFDVNSVKVDKETKMVSCVFSVDMKDANGKTLYSTKEGRSGSIADYGMRYDLIEKTNLFIMDEGFEFLKKYGDEIRVQVKTNSKG